MTSWEPGKPRIGRSHDRQLLDWGVPFSYEDDCLFVPRLLDARAYDAARRVHAHSSSPAVGARLQRAVFERARRDEKFLEALEIALVARIQGGMPYEALLRFVEDQLEEPYELYWCHNLQVEDATAAVIELARQFVRERFYPKDAITTLFERALARLDAVETSPWMQEVRAVMVGKSLPRGYEW